MTTHRTSLQADDETVEELLDLAEDALDNGDPHQGIALCAQVLHSHPDHAGALFVTADAYRDLGFLADAEQAYRRVTSTVPNHAPGWSGLAVVLFEQIRFDEARRAAHRALRLDPANSEASYVRGLLRERDGDETGAERDFLRASRADPTVFPRPVALSDDDVVALVEDAVALLPAAVQAFLVQVPIVVEEVPPEELCRQFDPPAPPGELLGVFNHGSASGSPPYGAWSQLQNTIVLFRRNMQRLAANRDQLLEELRAGVFYEVEQYLTADNAGSSTRAVD